MSELVDVGLHSSLGFEMSMATLAESLLAGCVPASFLYRGARSAALWERLHLAHAPSAQTDASMSPHHKAFQFLLKKAAVPLHVISIGCGLAEKEMILLDLDEASVGEIDLLDGSMELVAEAKRRWMLKSHQVLVRGLAADLAAAGDWSALVSNSLGSARVFTLFGMVPNFEIGQLMSRINGVARSGDWLVLDANLRPSSLEHDGDIPQSIVSQYDNSECRAWLLASLAELGIYETDGEISFGIEPGSQGRRAPRIQVSFELKRDVDVSLPGRTISFRQGAELSVFYSYRYRAEDMPRIMREGGFSFGEAWYSESGEDGVYVFRKN